MNDVSDTIRRVTEALKNVYDPEIPVNVYDLGLVYEVNVEKGNSGPRIRVLMGMTTPFCPLGGLLVYMAEQAIKEAVPEAEEVRVEITLEPPWSPERITQEGRERLKSLYGYDIVEEMLKRRGKGAEEGA